MPLPNCAPALKRLGPSLIVVPGCASLRCSSTDFKTGGHIQRIPERLLPPTGAGGSRSCTGAPSTVLSKSPLESIERGFRWPRPRTRTRRTTSSGTRPEAYGPQTGRQRLLNGKRRHGDRPQTGAETSYGLARANAETVLDPLPVRRANANGLVCWVYGSRPSTDPVAAGPTRAKHSSDQDVIAPCCKSWGDEKGNCRKPRTTRAWDVPSSTFL